MNALPKPLTSPKPNTPVRQAGSDQAQIGRINGMKEEVRGGIAYIQCGHMNPKIAGPCTGMLPLDRTGTFQGRCGTCGWLGTKRAWWLSVKQREFKAERKLIRDRVEKGEAITLAEFDFVAKDFV